MVSAPAGRRAPGTPESEVMGRLWARDEPVAAAGVQAAIGGDPACNTVPTILTRLHDKHLVHRRKTGRGHVYRPVEDAAAALRALLARS